jgi:hypothetical protein
MCVFNPKSCATSVRMRVDSSDSTLPPQKLCVFSNASSVVGGWCRLAPRTALRIRSGSIPPSTRLGSADNINPPNREAPPTSARTMCAWSPNSTSSPGVQCVSSATKLAIVPLGTSRAAAFPIRAAAAASNALIVGSSP